jgi:hypothetical protein
MYLYNLLKEHIYMNLVLFFLCIVVIIIFIYQKIHADYRKLQIIYIHGLF